MICGRTLAVALVAATACAHAPARAPLPEVTWPEAPAPVRARLAATFPDPAAPAPPRPTWRRVLDFLTGYDAVTHAPPWLVRPFGVAATDAAWFVADPDGQEVLRVDATGPRRLTCRDVEWAAPMAVAAAPDGALFVADGGAGTIVVIEPDGRCRSVGAGQLGRPTGVAVASGRVLVADPARHEVVVLSRAGEVVARWGERGEGRGRFHFPTAIAAAPDGTVLVVDALNFRIVRLAADGAWLGEFGSPGDTGGDFARPKGVAVDAAGRIYVSDAQRDVVLVYDRTGAFEYALGAPGAAPGRLAFPAGVAIAGDRVYVADSFNARIQVFDLVGGGP